MMFIWIILFVIVYIAIGGLLGGLIGDEELDVACALGWPLILIFGLFVDLYFLAKAFGEWVKNQVFDKEGRE